MDYRLRVDPDGTTIAAATEKVYEINLIDTASGKVLHTLRGH